MGDTDDTKDMEDNMSSMLSILSMTSMSFVSSMSSLFPLQSSNRVITQLRTQCNHPAAQGYGEGGA